MSHRKVYSQGSIPFSWEDKPGISKVTNQDCLIHGTNLQALDLKISVLRPPPSLLSINSSPTVEANYNKKIIPLPPCRPSTQPPRRSTSSKDYRWQDDPFLVAYKECTKTDLEGGGKKGFVFGSKALRKKSKSVFSCKNSRDARDDNLIKLSNLPPLPRQKIHSLCDHGAYEKFNLLAFEGN